MKSPHRVLGVSKDASPSDIKSAFNRLALKYHPDRKDGSSERFRKVLEAYDEVRDRTRREHEMSIGDFEQQYRGSEEELEEIKCLYERFKGNVCKIIDNMIIGKDDDEERIREYVTKWVSSGEVKCYPKFEKRVSENKRRLALRAKEAAIAEEINASKPLPKRDSWMQFISSLEQKYGCSQPKKRKRDARA